MHEKAHTLNKKGTHHRRCNSLEIAFKLQEGICNFQSVLNSKRLIVTISEIIMELYAHIVWQISLNYRQMESQRRKENTYFCNTGQKSYREATVMGLTWPPYISNLKTCETVIWDYIKYNMYRNNHKTIDKLKTAIQDVIDSIFPTLQQIMSNFAIRLHHIMPMMAAISNMT